MMDKKKQRAWKRYYDSENQAFYWYNEETGQSRWEEDEIDGSHSKKEDNLESNPLLTSNLKQQDADSSVKPFEFENNLNQKGDADKKRKKKVKKKSSILDSSDLDSSQRGLVSEDISVEVDQEDESSADYDLLCYGRFAKCNAFLFEAPFCVIEGALRIVMLLFLMIAFTIYYLSTVRALDKYFVSIVKRISRDIVLTLASMLSLSIPGMIWYVYQSHKSVNNWKLRRIPTVCGNVDPRRYLVITVFGLGSIATNASVALSEINRDSLDKWNDSCFYYPRNLVEELQRFMNGRRNVESLELAFSAPEL